MIEGRRIEVRGTVQGVGFRPWVYRLARRAGLQGRVRNHTRGVTIEAFGVPNSLAEFLRQLEVDAPPTADIVELRTCSIPVEPVTDFVIANSDRAGGRSVTIPPDQGTCDKCLAEVLDRGNRRFGYPFTNCTDCGPRFTIATDVPYDRDATTMSGFELCSACASEFDDPTDRRFHAQPNACPDCGPRVALWSRDGTPVPTEDAIREAAEYLKGGAIVAIKGLGGFHLACDARDRRAVRLLRQKKGRDQKPFAIMVAGIDAVGALAEADPTEVDLLRSPERPIVLLRRRRDAFVAPEVAPGTDRLGVFLPYTPLHHLLLARAAVPLVMTSGNAADEPICIDNDEAVDRLGSIADWFLVHDRPIAARCDDSVARVIGKQATIIRRSRGHVPRAVALPVAVERPVLAVGAHLKNTFCIAVGNEAYFGPHIGDLDSPEAMDFLAEAVQHLERLLGVRPDVVAHDLHSGYASTRYALSRAGVRTVGVQHHHAHVVSAMTEHGLVGPVLGVAYDGTGYGTDGTAWGAEIMLCHPSRFRRLATFRPFKLPGGNVAMREVWRCALGLLHDAYAGAPPIADLSLFGRVPSRAIRVASDMLDKNLNAPRARGVGRYFDAVGGLVLDRPNAGFEAQVAVAFEALADPTETGCYPYDLMRVCAPAEIDLRRMVRALVEDLRRRVDPRKIAARFHNTIVRATVSALYQVGEAAGNPPVVLTGGAFQNTWLAEGVSGSLRGHWDCFRHGLVPPGDGGLALGQVVIADAVLKGETESCA